MSQLSNPSPACLRFIVFRNLLASTVVAVLVLLVSRPFSIAQADDPPSQQAKLAEPSASEQAQAESSLREDFQREFSTLGRPESAKILANRMFDEARSSESDPVRQFVLLTMGADLAAEAGDAESALNAITRLANTFDVDKLSLQAQAMETSIKSARGREGNHNVTVTGLNLIADLVDANSFEHAASIARSVSAAARQSGDPHLRGLATEQNRRIGKLSSAAKNIAPLLNQEPETPQEHDALGRFLALEKEDWNAALPHLAKSDDPKIQQAATDDLKNPTAAEAQLSLAETWWQLADQSRKSEQAALRRRAGHWYRQALPELSGNVRANIMQKCARIPSTRAQLQIKMIDFDGAGLLHLTPEGIRYEHIDYRRPKGFQLNQLIWDLEATDTIKNRGATQFLPEGVSVDTARMVQRQGRDQVQIIVEPNHVVIKVHDKEHGADNYEVILTFGQ